jgi:hypothetical protein
MVCEFPSLLPRGVTVAQVTLDHFVMVRIHARQFLIIKYSAGSYNVAQGRISVRGAFELKSGGRCRIERLPIGRGQDRNLSQNRAENRLSVIPNKEVVSIKHFQFEAAARV